jgi:hypothetical protein
LRRQDDIVVESGPVGIADHGEARNRFRIEEDPMSPTLSVVATNNDLKPQTVKPENVAERVKRLQAEARQLARDHIRALTAAIEQVELMAAEVSDGGDAYPPGVRDVARRLVEDMGCRAQTLEAIVARS